jgi:hypothetical protein
MDCRFGRENAFEENGSADATRERHVAMQSLLLGIMRLVFIAALQGSDALSASRRVCAGVTLRTDEPLCDATRMMRRTSIVPCDTGGRSKMKSERDANLAFSPSGAE